MAELDHEAIKALVRSYFQECLNRSDELIGQMRSDITSDLDAEANAADELVRNHLDLIKKGRPDAVSREEADRLMERHHFQPKSVPLGLRHDLYGLVLRARVEDWMLIATEK